MHIQDNDDSVNVEHGYARFIRETDEIATKKVSSLSYSFGILNVFPDMYQLEQKHLGDYDEIQAMNRLFKNNPRDVGSMARQWLEVSSGVSKEKGEAAEKVLSELLYQSTESNKLYDQLELPRFLNPQGKNGTGLSSEEKERVLEFIVGFAGPNPREHRDQLNRFHKLTSEDYKMDGEFSYEAVSPRLENNKGKEDK